MNGEVMIPPLLIREEIKPASQPMFKTYFTQTQVVLLAVSALLILVSLVFHNRNKPGAALMILFLATLGIFFLATLLDPFLNIWDERFHAVVAKNMVKHLFKPTLFDDPVITFPPYRWDRTYIWLHKQPLFLWQIALIFKLFGVNLITLRIPSAILGSLLVLISYRTGKLLVSEKVGYYTALLFTTSFTLTEMISGRQQMDHNDVAFLFYVSASLWAWCEYVFSGKRKWVILVGIFCGFAILNKWLFSLVIYLIWGIFMLTNHWHDRRKIIDFLFALLITVVIFLPWQLYTFHKFPVEANAEFQYNRLHFNEVVEGHGGDFWYHFDKLAGLYGKLVPYVLLVGFVLFYKKTIHKNAGISVLSFAGITYLFFSLAQTKMVSYTFVSALPVYLALACLIDYFAEKIQQLKIIRLLRITLLTLFLFLIGYMNINLEELQSRHTTWKKDNMQLPWAATNIKTFHNFTKTLPANAVIFNFPRQHNMECMFFTDFPCYNFIPDYEQYTEVKKKNRPIVILNGKNEKMPDYLLRDNTVIFRGDWILEYD
ncbi:MAG: glycosyltransferase family 39 protein [Bacteroidetes bacterium]|nr:glycosyltransferase family 39 protein [Bacteroidota bacterium]